MDERARTCPANHALVNVTGYPLAAGMNLRGLTLFCAPLSVEKKGDAYTLKFGTGVPQMMLGYLGPNFYMTKPTCPDNHVVSGLHGWANNIVRGMGLVCTEVQMSFP